jgi:hypothetical protein
VLEVCDKTEIAELNVALLRLTHWPVGSATAIGVSTKGELYTLFN